jgi:hypothetical protein
MIRILLGVCLIIISGCSFFTTLKTRYDFFREFHRVQKNYWINLECFTHLSKIEPEELMTPKLFFVRRDWWNSLQVYWSYETDTQFDLLIKVDGEVVLELTPDMTIEDWNSVSKKEKFQNIIYLSSFQLSNKNLLLILTALEEGKEVTLQLSKNGKAIGDIFDWKNINKSIATNKFYKTGCENLIELKQRILLDGDALRDIDKHKKRMRLNR